MCFETAGFDNFKILDDMSNHFTKSNWKFGKRHLKINM
jgi:hypothetical protein